MPPPQKLRAILSVEQLESRIVPSNSPPTATDDFFLSDEDTVISSANVLTNTNPYGADSDPDAGDTLTVSEVNCSAANVGVPIMLASGAL